MVSLMVILYSTKCFLFVYMYTDLLRLKAYKLFENSDADLSWFLFLPIATQCRILMHERYIPVENIVGNGEIAYDKQLHLFSQYFLPYIALFFFLFKCTLKCRLQFVSIWISLKFCRQVMG